MICPEYPKFEEHYWNPVRIQLDWSLGYLDVRNFVRGTE